MTTMLRRGLAASSASNSSGGCESQEDSGGGGCGGGAKAQQAIMWSAANSVAWGARFLGPNDGDGSSGTSSSLSNSTTTNSTSAATPQSSTSSDGNKSSTLFIGIIVSLIIAFYLLCTYQCLRIWLCRKCFGREVDIRGRTLSASMHADGGGQGGGPDGTVLVHEGRVFNLSGDQRRQVLEVIFSETSKPATDMDVAKLKKKRRRRNGGGNNHNGADSLDGCEDDDYEGGDHDTDDDDDSRFGGVPLDVQIPGVATAQTDDTSTDDGTASPSSQVRSPVTAAAAVAGAGADGESAALELDGDASITSQGEIVGDTCDDDEDDSGGASSLSVSDPDSTKDKSPDAADKVRDFDGPSTPESKGAREEIVVTPIRLDFAGDGRNVAPFDEDATPRAACHQPTALFDGGVSQAPLAPSPPVETSATSPRRGLAPVVTPSPRSSAIGDETAMLRTMVALPTLRPAPKSKNFVIPENETVEEAKREIVSGESGDAEEDDAVRDLSLRIPIPLMKRESFASATSEYTYDDGSTITGDNVCPICLSGFKIGDLLVTSKYCSHVFHKECILEWLDKSDNCPVCRVDMVTALEMNKAATTLVGKTRMVRAVASLQANSSHSRAPPASSPQRPGSAVSPFEGTVRRRAHSANYS